jgi:hypothetical protein
VRKQIHLRHQDEIGVLEHHRILDRFVFTFRDRQRDDVHVLAEVIYRWADQVADVFDEQVIE